MMTQDTHGEKRGVPSTGMEKPSGVGPPPPRGAGGCLCPACRSHSLLPELCPWGPSALHDVTDSLQGTGGATGHSVPGVHLRQQAHTGRFRRGGPAVPPALLLRTGPSHEGQTAPSPILPWLAQEVRCLVPPAQTEEVASSHRSAHIPGWDSACAVHYFN